jgi:hypothetical protein
MAWHPLTFESTALPSTHAGRIRITTSDDSVATFDGLSVQNDTVVGMHVVGADTSRTLIPVTRIKKIERYALDPGKAVGYTVLGAATAYTILYLFVRHAYKSE